MNTTTGRSELARRLGAQMSLGEPPARPVVVEEKEPERFMTAFTAAVASGADVMLADPTWSEMHRAEVAALVHSAIGDRQSAFSSRGWLMIPSGGSGGGVKFARHDEETIGAAVRGFCAHFGLTRVNAVGVLPLHHVSGLMAWMRCALTGGEFVPWDWKRLEAGERLTLRAGADWVISLVPTQLQRLLMAEEAVAWLRQFRVIFLGGGPVWPQLADAAAEAKLPISLSYGMTETAAMVTALRPEEFLAGDRSCGAPLPHARVTIDAEGVVTVAGESLFRGYYVNEAPKEKCNVIRYISGGGPGWVTEDLGSFDERGHLHILGRRDAVIITGGKKVHPNEVEAVLRASGEFDDVAVIGLPDAEWGEAVVACHPPSGRAPNLERAVAALAPHQRPKRFIAVADWPRNSQGKVSRAELRRAAAANHPGSLK